MYFSLRLRQDITSKWNWLENIFSTCRFEDFFRACFFDNNFLTIVAVNIYLFLWIFLALAALKKVLWVAWLTVFTYWILISYNESVSQLITGRPLQGPRLAARLEHVRKVRRKFSKCTWKKVSVKKFGIIKIFRFHFDFRFLLILIDCEFDKNIFIASRYHQCQWNYLCFLAPFCLFLRVFVCKTDCINFKFDTMIIR